ncbi:hypothetical protein Hanom_Chr17g01561171 [Helianthus anomalus]
MSLHQQILRSSSSLLNWPNSFPWLSMTSISIPKPIQGGFFSSSFESSVELPVSPLLAPTRPPYPDPNARFIDSRAFKASSSGSLSQSSQSTSVFGFVTVAYTDLHHDFEFSFDFFQCKGAEPSTPGRVGSDFLAKNSCFLSIYALEASSAVLNVPNHIRFLLNGSRISDAHFPHFLNLTPANFFLSVCPNESFGELELEFSF